MWLVGDIGGTHSRLALIEPSTKEQTHLEIFKSNDFSDFNTLLEHYLNKYPSKIGAACLAVAGPVIKGTSELTNIAFKLEEKSLSSLFKIPKVFLLNDLEAAAFALDNVQKIPLIENNTYQGNRALIIPGTGLGIAALFFDGKNHHPFATEKGNADFAPTSEIELELSRYLITTFTFPRTEKILSGRGLLTLFHFFQEIKKRKVEDHVTLEMQKKDPAVVIVENGLNNTSEICTEIVNLFVTILAQECGNTALTYMTYGGIFLGGAIIKQILPKLKTPLFQDNYLQKTPFRSLLEKMPIYTIAKNQITLLGATEFLSQNIVSLS